MISVSVHSQHLSKKAIKETVRYEPSLFIIFTYLQELSRGYFAAISLIELARPAIPWISEGIMIFVA